jgi:endogenous inhibitor of DNA gyrase (YacG/DUF329 family)
MPRVRCRCGENIKIHGPAPERIDCPTCGARIRFKRKSKRDPGDYLPGDGFLRFYCPCGRRLKVAARNQPDAGKCPDCGRIVPIPDWVKSGAAGPGPVVSDPEARTEELDSADQRALAEWTSRFTPKPGGDHPSSTTSGMMPITASADLDILGVVSPQPSIVKFEAGLRICPRCNKPVHLGSEICRECGTPVPRS